MSTSDPSAIRAHDWVLQVDLQEPRAAVLALDALAETWAVLLASPPQTVVAITDQNGNSMALKMNDQLEVIVIPF